jgi:fermentation-respiration switch protein FrsA (DUF1100 family)
VNAQRRGMVLNVVTWLLAGYAAIVGLLFLSQRALLFPARQDRPAPAAMGVPEMQVISLRTRDGLDLVGWFHPAPAYRYTVLSFHGNGDFIGAHALLARRLIDAGHGVLLVSYRGYSGNPGSPSEAGLYDDGRAAMAFLEARNEAVVLHGFSLGAAVAVRMAVEHRVHGVILEAPFTAAADIAASAYPFVPVRWLMRDPFDTLPNLGAIRVPVLVIHGTRDEVVPAAQSDRVYDAIAAPKQRVVIDGAGHNDLWRRGGDGHAALDFLAALAQPARAR